jgi:hypothetical protein
LRRAKTERYELNHFDGLAMPPRVASIPTDRTMGLRMSPPIFGGYQTAELNNS